MSKDWRATFESWGAPPSASEQDECARTEREIREALEPLERSRRFLIYPKGSNRRGTNVRRGSDIDMAVEMRGVPTEESFHFAKSFSAKELSDEALGLVPLRHSPPELLDMAGFKKEVHDLLVAAFGARAVSWSNKCIKIREKATTLPADVVACRYYRRYDSATAVHEGIEIRPDRGPAIINWPKQDDDNGIAKNKRTNLRFKRVVRGLKSLENEMVDNGVIEPVPSFLIECAAYNVPDAAFDSPQNFDSCIECLKEFARVGADPHLYSEWKELNRLKYLFRPSQPWTFDDLDRLVTAATKPRSTDE